MARTNEDIISMCDRITTFCIRLNERLDAADRQAYMEWQLPTHNQYVVAHSWQQDRTSFYQPDWYRPPPDPDPPYAPPAYANHAVDNPFYMAFDAAAPPLQEPDRRMGVFAEMESHLSVTDRRVDSLRLPEPEPPNAHPDCQQPTSGPLSGFNLPSQVVQPSPLGSQPQPYFHNTDPYRQPTSQIYTDPWQQEQLVYRPPPPPPLTATLPHQYYLQMPPPKTYKPLPPSILDCDRVEDGSADSTERIHDSSTGFDGVEKVEKMEKSSQDFPRKEKPVQGREEIECSRQSSHHDHPQPPSCSHRCSATAPLPLVAAAPNSTPTCTTSASPLAVITPSRSCPEHSVVDAVPPPPQAAITSTWSPDRIDTLSPAPLPIVPPPQVVLSPPCSLDMINIAVQRRGKSSILDGEIESILTNQGTIGGIASRNQPMIMGVDSLQDIIMEQVKIFLKDTYAFDPGGITCEACYWRSSLLLDSRFDSHLEDKVDFNRGGVDTAYSLRFIPISLLFS